MSKTIFVAFLLVFSAPVFAHKEYAKSCEKQQVLRKEIETLKNDKDRRLLRGTKYPLFFNFDKEIKKCEKEIEQLENTKRQIENVHDIRIKHIKLSNIPDVDWGKPGHADLRIYHDRQLKLVMDNCQSSVEFPCDIKIKRADTLRIRDEDPTGFDDIGYILLRTTIQEILRKEETQGRFLVKLPIPDQPPCKVEIFYEVKSRNK